ncbi:MAG: hypothetical protein RIM84_03370 [Alphaproteobacteria bacterium]
MQFPVWTKPALWGAAVGGAALAIVAFSAGWVVTSSTAAQMAASQSSKAVIASLTPICVAKYQMESEKPALLATLQGRSNWTRGDWIEEKGWATMPGSEKPDSQVADACATELMKLVAS